MVAKNSLTMLLLSLAVSGCQEVENLLTFTISDQTAIRIESASPLDLPLEIPTPDVTSNSKQQYQNNHTRADLVQDVRLEQLKLSITAPDSKTFSFLKAIHIYISTDQSDEMELASLTDISTNEKTLALPTTEKKLDVYLKASSYNLRTEVTTRETLTQSVDVQVDLQFQVTAKPF